MLGPRAVGKLAGRSGRTLLEAARGPPIEDRLAALKSGVANRLRRGRRRGHNGGLVYRARAGLRHDHAPGRHGRCGWLGRMSRRLRTGCGGLRRWGRSRHSFGRCGGWRRGFGHGRCLGHRRGWLADSGGRSNGYWGNGYWGNGGRACGGWGNGSWRRRCWYCWCRGRGCCGRLGNGRGGLFRRTRVFFLSGRRRRRLDDDDLRSHRNSLAGAVRAHRRFCNHRGGGRVRSDRRRHRRRCDNWWCLARRGNDFARFRTRGWGWHGCCCRPGRRGFCDNRCRRLYRQTAATRLFFLFFLFGQNRLQGIAGFRDMRQINLGRNRLPMRNP